MYFLFFINSRNGETGIEAVSVWVFTLAATAATAAADRPSHDITRRQLYTIDSSSRNYVVTSIASPLLRGIHVPKLLAVETVLVKVMGTACSVASGLPVGPEVGGALIIAPARLKP